MKPSEIACGLDVGLQFIVADDAGNVVAPPKYYRQSEKQLKRLQRKLRRQESGSGKQKKTQHRLARLHERIADQRRLFNHKLSTYRVRTYGAIAVEDIKLANLVRRSKPVETEEGSCKWQHNYAFVKSGLNKSFLDAGLGQLLSMMEVKAKAGGREFVRVSAAYTSCDCPECGYRQKKSLSQRTHLCQQCGYTTKRDTAAAQVIKGKASFAGRYRSQARKFIPVDRLADDFSAPPNFSHPTQLVLPLTLDCLPDKNSINSTPPKRGGRQKQQNSKPKPSKGCEDQISLPL